MLLSLFAGCSNKNDIITQEQAQKIAITEAGLSADEISDVHTHIITENGLPCYSVHLSAGDKEYSFVIKIADGSIISSGNETGH